MLGLIDPWKPKALTLEVRCFSVYPGEMYVDTRDKLTFIKTEWDDIHHSRRQEWTFLGAILPVLYMVSNVDDTAAKTVCSFLASWWQVSGLVCPGSIRGTSRTRLS